MNTPKKPRSNSPLRTLPDERQAAIIERLKTGSRDDVRKWLAEDGFTTSTGALSEFWSWWHLRQQFKQNQSDVETLLDNLRKQEPTLSEEKLFAYGQRVFSVLAVKNEDAKDWARIQSVGLEGKRIAGLERKVTVAEEALKLAEKKFRRDTCELFIKWYGDKAAKEITSSNLSHSDKIEKLGQTMFGEDW
jgi:hypothetical protein